MNWHQDFLQAWSAALLHSTETKSPVAISMMYHNEGVLLGTLDESTPRTNGGMIYDYFESLIKKSPVGVEFDADPVVQYLTPTECLVSGYYTFHLEDSSLPAKYTFHVEMVSEGEYKVRLHNSGRRGDLNA